jgi:hypothetical protein
MSVIRGVDGCKAGWLCLSVRPDETRPTATVFGPDARALLAERRLRFSTPFMRFILKSASSQSGYGRRHSGCLRGIVDGPTHSR